jgi:hypothetical protein
MPGINPFWGRSKSCFLENMGDISHLKGSVIKTDIE